jgi:acyl carrier protein
MSVTTHTTVHRALVEALVALEIQPDEIQPDTALRADLDVDSAELVELVASIRGQAPDGKALKGVRTVSELQAFLGLD